ncbi:uncharacterized protein N7515_008925 [Penicillium bovifimosum]|uniref:Retrotransposon gag domain-containing protein n=1 Tax=Penicillium bovifimosum TaxID=126998 RepID=A0A9W9GQE6_9EURO|nr:uncharacterized protein N7515_008925 [Penicillium bovifimosum]KAJ5125100.1 hypothetical protein N7515_008925 [Penicillium bovifimosum]
MSAPERKSSRLRKEKETEMTRTTLVFENGDDTDNEGNSMELTTLQELQDWVKQDPEAAWNVMTKQQKILTKQQEEIKELKNAVSNSNDKVKELNDQIQILQQRATSHTPAGPDQLLEEEYARLREEMQTVQNERDSLVVAMKLLSSNPVSPASELAELKPRKSVKMPDPPMLKDGKEVKFMAWRSDIKKKLRFNADHYPTPDHQMAYLKSRCEGKALSHIDPRMQDDSMNQYKTVDEILDHLESVFHNPDRKHLARNEYLALKMEPKQDFTDFLAEFTRLAEEANQPTGYMLRVADWSL